MAIWAGVVKVTEEGLAEDPKVVEISGVSAGRFDARLWAKGPPALLPDVRQPLLMPRAGNCRNIYAPSVVEMPEGWRVFYGAWDGTVDGHDRIYSVLTSDFRTFTDRHTVIEHGEFAHVCNVSALRFPDGKYALTCTGYPDAKGLNKPVSFTSPDGKTWNGSPEPYAAKRSDIISIDGYKKYLDADINGMNVSFYESGKWWLYFADFKSFDHVYRAVASDGKHYRFVGPVTPEGHVAVNDMKKLGGWYLMGLHMNTDRIFYSLSHDPAKFPSPRVLFEKRSEDEAYMVAVGWVTRGDQLLGVLYGAGAKPTLDVNRIYARWLQKKVVFVSNDHRTEPKFARGPDRQLLDLPAETAGRLEVYSDDGKLQGVSSPVTLKPGMKYRID
jgi:hypothetical protein